MAFHVWLAYCVAAWVIALSPGAGGVLMAMGASLFLVKRVTN